MSSCQLTSIATKTRSASESLPNIALEYATYITGYSTYGTGIHEPYLYFPRPIPSLHTWVRADAVVDLSRMVDLKHSTLYVLKEMLRIQRITLIYEVLQYGKMRLNSVAIILFHSLSLSLSLFPTPFLAFFHTISH